MMSCQDRRGNIAQTPPPPINSTRPIFSWSLLKPPFRWSVHVLSCDIAALLLALVIFQCPLHLSIVAVPHIFQIFLGHQFSIHATLQIILGQVPAFVVHVPGFLQTQNVHLHGLLALRVVVQWEHASLRWPDKLLAAAEAHGRHGGTRNAPGVQI
jgi:hypothetical protein